MYQQNQHITEYDLLHFQTDSMNPQEKLLFLEHTCSCNFCSEQLAKAMEEELLTAPVDMKENIMKAVRRPEMQLKKKINVVSKNVQLLFYSLKVSAAALGSLAVLMLVINFTNIPPASSQKASKDNFNNYNHTVSLTSTLRENMDTISSRMLSFSNNIMKTEGNIND